MTNIILTEDALYAIEKFTLVSIENAKAGGINKADWEESRSYAVEAITRLLRDNPEVFRYRDEMEKFSYRNVAKNGG